LRVVLAFSEPGKKAKRQPKISDNRRSKCLFFFLRRPSRNSATRWHLSARCSMFGVRRRASCVCCCVTSLCGQTRSVLKCTLITSRSFAIIIDQHRHHHHPHQRLEFPSHHAIKTRIKTNKQTNKQKTHYQYENKNKTCCLKHLVVPSLLLVATAIE
jgi:hypothetical protein